jgi:hypothetical protein
VRTQPRGDRRRERPQGKALMRLASGRRNAGLGIVVGAALAGCFDLIFAFWFFGARGRSPTWILQSIAAGWMGEPAFSGGMAAALLGLFSHFCILLVAAAVFHAASRRLKLVRDHAIVAGLLFGAAIYVVMNFVVIPVSAFPYRPAHTMRAVLPMLSAHMLLVGLPIALAVRYIGLRRNGRF